mmetsp:Transcript_8448/g.34335  ORF Transcript_8448/g.34335 Transcript_8448/m.34335 type:complete len:219 (-) Transcript_8448:1133-1789(-)
MGSRAGASRAITSTLMDAWRATRGLHLETQRSLRRRCYGPQRGSVTSERVSRLGWRWATATARSRARALARRRVLVARLKPQRMLPPMSARHACSAPRCGCAAGSTRGRRTSSPGRLQRTVANSAPKGNIRTSCPAWRRPCWRAWRSARARHTWPRGAPSTSASRATFRRCRKSASAQARRVASARWSGAREGWWLCARARRATTTRSSRASKAPMPC